jgi:tetratricopeptide (TPR) repeat protein
MLGSSDIVRRHTTRARTREMVQAIPHDRTGATRHFDVARDELLKTLAAQPNYPRALAVLAMTDAALGRNEDAIREGQRAVELLPVSQEALNGASQLRYLAITYIWVGQNDSALEALSNAARLPSDTTFGQLKLHPVWDPLRGGPRFEKIIASLAGSNEVHA